MASSMLSPEPPPEGADGAEPGARALLDDELGADRRSAEIALMSSRATEALVALAAAAAPARIACR